MIIENNAPSYRMTNVFKVLIKGLDNKIEIKFNGTGRDSAEAVVVSDELGESGSFRSRYAHSNTVLQKEILEEVNEVLSILGQKELQIGGQLLDAVRECFRACDALYGCCSKDHYLHEASAIIIFTGE